MKAAMTAAAVLLLLSTAAHAGEVGITLRGSRASMERQNLVARAESYSFLRTTRQVVQFAGAGRLVPVPGSSDYQVVADWPFARPTVRDFVELLARDYRRACAEPLVVTSLTRPSSRQPGNASPLSVHPAGMAVDLRVSQRGSCVRWLEAELLRLEGLGVLDGTREYYPPHFHVAVFPESFASYLAGWAADSARSEADRRDSIEARAHRELLAALPPVPTIGAVPQPPAMLWSDVLLVLTRFLFRV